jgi:hypothetical protein
VQGDALADAARRVLSDVDSGDFHGEISESTYAALESALAARQPLAQAPFVWSDRAKADALEAGQFGFTEADGQDLGYTACVEACVDAICAVLALPEHRTAPPAQGIDLGQFHAVLTEVAAERARQEQKWGQQNHVDWTRTTATSDLAGVWPGGVGPHFKWITDYKAAGKEGHALGYFDILMEEVGEAHDEAREGNVSALREEVIQVAAVAVAWVECIDRRQALIHQRDAAPGVSRG